MVLLEEIDDVDRLGHRRFLSSTPSCRTSAEHRVAAARCHRAWPRRSRPVPKVHLPTRSGTIIVRRSATMIQGDGHGTRTAATIDERPRGVAPVDVHERRPRLTRSTPACRWWRCPSRAS
jgi:hypothetical protein